MASTNCGSGITRTGKHSLPRLPLCHFVLTMPIERILSITSPLTLEG